MIRNEWEIHVFTLNNYYFPLWFSLKLTGGYLLHKQCRKFSEINIFQAGRYFPTYLSGFNGTVMNLAWPRLFIKVRYYECVSIYLKCRLYSNGHSNSSYDVTAYWRKLKWQRCWWKGEKDFLRFYTADKRRKSSPLLHQQRCHFSLRL